MFSWRAYPARAGASPGSFLTVPDLEQAGIRVAFTGRAGGQSGAPLDSLNLSYVAGDDPGVVRFNRARALAAIGGTLDEWTSGQQIHGAKTQQATAAVRGSGSLGPEDTLRDTDAMWTDEPGVALAILTADCVPLLLADPERRMIAAVHVGWRGLAGGIVENGSRALDDGTVAYIGPSIGPCCFEVGDDVAREIGSLLGEEVVVRREGLKPHVDLWKGTRIALARAGITIVHGAELCTRCEPHRFYSHRAGHAARQGLLVRIVP